MTTYQTVKLSAGRHRSPVLGACVMELASMLAREPFSDRPATTSPVIGAFLRTYNDGLDEARRQDLYALAALIVGTAGGRRLERERARRRARLPGRDPAEAVEQAMARAEACRV